MLRCDDPLKSLRKLEIMPIELNWPKYWCYFDLVPYVEDPGVFIHQEEIEEIPTNQ